MLTSSVWAISIKTDDPGGPFLMARRFPMPSISTRET
jgi:hypothetical protein